MAFKRSPKEMQRLRALAASIDCAEDVFFSRLAKHCESKAVAMGKSKPNKAKLKAKRYFALSVDMKARTIKEWIIFKNLRFTYDAMRRWVINDGIEFALKIGAEHDKKKKAKLIATLTGRKLVAPIIKTEELDENLTYAVPRFLTSKKEESLGIKELAGVPKDLYSHLVIE